jgi:hypothetical protein
MIDGKFKKRIQNQINKQKSESKTPDDFELNYIHQVYINLLLDEAKKEFPLVLQPGTIDALQYEIKEREENVPLVARNKNVILVLKWALKWFGDF